MLLFLTRRRRRIWSCQSRRIYSVFSRAHASTCVNLSCDSHACNCASNREQNSKTERHYEELEVLAAQWQQPLRQKHSCQARPRLELGSSESKSEVLTIAPSRLVEHIIQREKTSTRSSSTRSRHAIHWTPRIPERTRQSREIAHR